ncbi:uncharacterized protein LOC131183384 [Hevea brasiliensis]|uniref:uncharacterized protein LOC131183384 n=1 Tax=Hevea brasiliensis TaxID=3981 RepID=UPI0025E7CD13|nr:uncharacterized protein LOC131183384 [Hevea brasiliensis]
MSMAESNVACFIEEEVDGYENLEVHNTEEDGLNQKLETSNTNTTVCSVCIEEDGNGNDEAAAADANDLNQRGIGESTAESNTDSSVPLLPETDNAIKIDDDNGFGNREYGQDQKPTTMERVERIFLIMNFIIELSTAAFDQLSSKRKPQFALISLLMSVIVMLISAVILVWKGQKERVKWMRRGQIPWFYYPSPSHKPFGAFPDIIGLVCAAFQCVFSIIGYSFLSRHANNPVKISVWPIIFAGGLLYSGFVGNSSRGKPWINTSPHKQLEMMRSLEIAEMALVDHRANQRKGAPLEHLELLRRLDQLEMFKDLGRLNLLEMLSANSEVSLEQLERLKADDHEALKNDIEAPI